MVQILSRITEMKIKSLLIIIYSFTGFLFFQGCTSTIRLSKSPSDLVLLYLKSNNKDSVNVKVNSKIAEPYEYKNSGGFKLIIPINQAFRDNMDAYISAKFNNLVSNQSINDSTTGIFIELKAFKIGYNFEQSTGDVLGTIFLNSGTKGDAIVDVSLTANVNIYKGKNNLANKNILATSKYNEKISSVTQVENIYAKAINDGISKCVIMIDKYISSIGL